jgi:hypothetical protein
MSARAAIAIVLFLGAACDDRTGDTNAAQPLQPASGPGGLDYAHGAAVITRYGTPLTDADAYWLVEPADPPASSAPVLVYMHGYGASEPDDGYEAMLTHFARKGFVVIFPYQGEPFDLADYEENARNAIVDALDELAGGEHPTPDGHLAFAGHSLGAMLALRLAGTGTPALPVPEVVVAQDLAGRRLFPDALADGNVLATIPASVRLLILQAETSAPGGPQEVESYAPEAWEGTPQIPRALRNFLRSHTDRHGTPILESEHNGCRAVANGRPLDAHDWYAYWRPTEAALREAAGAPFAGYSAFCSELGAACDATRDAGTWGDGVAVRTFENAADLGL